MNRDRLLLANIIANAESDVTFEFKSPSELRSTLEGVDSDIFEWLEDYVALEKQQDPPLQDYEAWCLAEKKNSCMSKQKLAQELVKLGFKKRRGRTLELYTPRTEKAFQVLQLALKIAKKLRSEKEENARGETVLDNALVGNASLTDAQRRRALAQKRKQELIEERKRNLRRENAETKRELRRKEEELRNTREEISGKEIAFRGLTSLMENLLGTGKISEDDLTPEPRKKRQEETRLLRDAENLKLTGEARQKLDLFVQNTQSTLENYKRDISKRQTRIRELETEVEELFTTVEELRKDKREAEQELSECLRGASLIVEKIPVELEQDQAQEIVDAVAIIIGNLEVGRRKLVSKSMRTYINSLRAALEDLERDTGVSPTVRSNVDRAAKRLVKQHKVHNRHGMQGALASPDTDLLGDGKKTRLARRPARGSTRVSVKPTTKTLDVSVKQEAEEEEEQQPGLGSMLMSTIGNAISNFVEDTSSKSDTSGGISSAVVQAGRAQLKPVQQAKVSEAPTNNLGYQLIAAFTEGALGRRVAIAGDPEEEEETETDYFSD